MRFIPYKLDVERASGLPCRYSHRHQTGAARCNLASRWTLAAVTLLAALLCPLFASSPTAWEMSAYNDFIKGRFTGISLGRDGRLALAPALESVFASGEPVVWSVVQAPDGTLYAATGHRGRVYRIGADGKSSVLWTAEQPEVFALAVDRAGAVYAAGSPDGAVYRIENGKATLYFDAKARYVWSLVVAPDGALYVGTGNQGKIFRVSSAGNGELYYDTGESHITGLAIDAQGRLLAGAEPNGILYRITAKDKAFVLYDAGLPEIRAIVPMPDGSIYAAALGGAMAKQEEAAQAARGASTASGIPTITETVTVQAQAGDLKPPDPNKQQQLAQPLGAAAAAGAPAAPAARASGEAANADKSAVYRINPDNTVETLWTSKEENVYDLLVRGDQLLFSTDTRGRIYGLARDLRVTLLAEAGEGETTRLLPSGNSVLAATADMGSIFKLGDAPGANGAYESPVHDAGTVSRWGGVSWRGQTPAGCSVAFRTRTGNSATPDRTWSDWSSPLTDASGSRIQSPNARFIQWKVELTGRAGATPAVDGVTVTYLPQNSPPAVRGINVTLQAGAAQAAKNASSAAYSVTVTDTADGGSGSAGTSTQVLARLAAPQISIAWQADDPDGDRLVYDLYFRGEDESEWKLLKGNLHDSSYSTDSDLFADGRYYFRVVASDREFNAPSSAREAQLVSAPTLIDNTPPIATIRVARRDGARAHIEFDAADAASALRRCEYSLDADRWIPVEPVDGVIDSPRERFTLDLTGLTFGEHLVVIRVADSANNVGTAKAILK